MTIKQKTTRRQVAAAWHKNPNREGWWLRCVFYDGLSVTIGNIRESLTWHLKQQDLARYADEENVMYYGPLTEPPQ